MRIIQDKINNKCPKMEDTTVDGSGMVYGGNEVNILYVVRDSVVWNVGNAVRRMMVETHDD